MSPYDGVRHVHVQIIEIFVLSTSHLQSHNETSKNQWWWFVIKPVTLDNFLDLAQLQSPLDLYMHIICITFFYCWSSSFEILCRAYCIVDISCISDLSHLSDITSSLPLSLETGAIKESHAKPEWQPGESWMANKRKWCCVFRADTTEFACPKYFVRRCPFRSWKAYSKHLQRFQDTLLYQHWRVIRDMWFLFFPRRGRRNVLF